MRECEAIVSGAYKHQNVDLSLERAPASSPAHVSSTVGHRGDRVQLCCGGSSENIAPFAATVSGCFP